MRLALPLKGISLFSSFILLRVPAILPHLAFQIACYLFGFQGNGRRKRLSFSGLLELFSLLCDLQTCSNEEYAQTGVNGNSGP